MQLLRRCKRIKRTESIQIPWEAKVWRSMDVGVRARDMNEEDMGISLESDGLVFNSVL